jgi:CxxC motif-containing protein (DUF1111 family)
MQGPPPPSIGGALPGLTAAQLARFNDGLVEFSAVEEPDEGLGPVFNGVSCAECHRQGAVGGAGFDLLQSRVTRIGGIVKGQYSDLADVGGAVIQRRSVKEFDRRRPVLPEIVPKEARYVSQRITTPLFGAGLIEAIPDSTLASLADPDDRNRDGISGRVSVVYNPLTRRNEAGRFGWKAQHSSLSIFSGDAYLNEMGITSPLFPHENLPQGKPIPPGSDPIPDPEDEGDDVELFADFMRFLAPPPVTRLSPQQERGARLFSTVGCIACHTPSLMTGKSAVAALSNKPVNLYSDLLLHDMGDGLADGIIQGTANGREFRTAPLWGVRFRRFLLHDGRALNAEQAILAHGGEAQAARASFGRLNRTNQADLLAFLNSL